MTGELIVDGAIRLIAEDRHMSMSGLARRLGVGRTTLYRYFPDREELLDEVRREGARRIVAALATAARAEGTGLEMLERCCEHLFSLGPELTLVLSGNPLIDDRDLAEAAREREGRVDRDNPIHVAVRTGHGDGSVDGDLSAEWIDTLLWTTLVAGQQYAERTGSRHQALILVLQSLRRSVGGVSGG